MKRIIDFIKNLFTGISSSKTSEEVKETLVESEQKLELLCDVTASAPLKVETEVKSFETKVETEVKSFETKVETEAKAVETKVEAVNDQITDTVKAEVKAVEEKAEKIVEEVKEVVKKKKKKKS